MLSFIRTLRVAAPAFMLAAGLLLTGARSASAAVDCTTSNCAVDFLFVIDNSVSMGTHQASLAAATGEMAAQLESDHIDWRVAVTYTDLRTESVPGAGDTCAGSPGPGSRVLCPFTRDMDFFKDGAAGCAYTNPGTCGGGAERGFSAARAALTRLNAGSGCESVPGGECFLREDANLVLIFVSDTGEQTSSGPVSGADNSIASWAAYFASQGVQVIHGINCPFDPTPDNPAPCGDGNVPAESYDRYRTIIAASDGVETSILDSDFGAAIRLIINAPENTGTTTTTIAPSTTTTVPTTTTTTTLPVGGTTTTTTPAGGGTTTTTTPGGVTTTTIPGGVTTTTTPGGTATTTTTTVGGSTTSTTTPGATTSTTTPAGATTTTTVSNPGGSTTTTLPTTTPMCTLGDDAACDDGDACTEDTCSESGRCRHDVLKGLDAIICRLPPPACGEITPRMSRRILAARRLVQKAAAATSAKKTRKLLVQAARTLKPVSTAAQRRARKGKLARECATQLGRVLLDTQSRTRP